VKSMVGLMEEAVLHASTLMNDWLDGALSFPFPHHQSALIVVFI
jgi:hypothetical protein